MITSQPARLGLAVGAVLVVAAAAVAGVILFASGKAGGVDLTSAEFVPADAGLYVAFNTDLSSSSWVTAFTLAERLGAESPEDSLRDAVADASLDWEDDVAPFLGGNAAIYVRGVDIDFLEVRGGVVARCNDCERAVRVLRRESGLAFDEDEHDGVTYLDGGALFVATTRDHLLVAMDEDSLLEMLDLAAGRGDSLSSSADFRRLRDDLSRDFLAFVYLAADELAVESLVDDEAVRDALRGAGVADIAFRPMAFAVGARADGFEAQAAAVGEPGASGGLLTPHASSFAAMVPAETAVFIHATGVAATWDAAVDGARTEIDRAIREAGQFADLDEALRAAGEGLGIESVEDLVGQLTGEMVVAIWFPSGDDEGAEGVLMAEVEDPARAGELLAALARSASDGRTSVKTVAGVEVTRFTGDDDTPAAFAIRDDHLIVGSLEGVRAVLELQGGGLAATGRYRSTLAGLSAPTGTFAYLDLPVLLRLTTGGMVPVLDEAEEALGPAVINLVSDGGLARALAFVSVPE